jgi:flagellar protein FlgJ
MSPLSAPTSIAGSLSASHGTDRAQLAQAAKQFEAIFVRQMLAAARKTDFGGDMLGSDGLQTFQTMQDEHFAEIASDTGAFGLAKMIEKQLGAQLTPSPTGAGAGEDSLRGPARRALPQPGGKD